MRKMLKFALAINRLSCILTLFQSTARHLNHLTPIFHYNCEIVLYTFVVYFFFFQHTKPMPFLGSYLVSSFQKRTDLSLATASRGKW